MRQVTWRGIGVLSLLLLLGCEPEDVAPLPLQSGWPRPAVGASVIHRVSFDMKGEMKVGDGTIEGVHAERTSAVVVRRAATGTGSDIVVTQGRTDGFFRVRGSDGERGQVPLAAGSGLAGGLVSAGLAPGAQAVLRLDAEGRPVDGNVASRPEASVLLPPPENALRVGLAWEAGVALPAAPTTDVSVWKARCEVTGIDEETIGVRMDWADLHAPSGPKLSGATFTLRISRRDGLVVSGTFSAEIETPQPGRPEGMWKAVIEGRVERVPWVHAPTHIPRVDALMRGLCAEDATVRRDAARSLAAQWPGGARAVPVLFAAREDEDPRVCEAATKTLASFAERAYEPVVAYLADEESPDRRGMLRALIMVSRLGAKLTPKDCVQVAINGSPCGGALLVALYDWRDLETLREVAIVLAGMAERRLTSGMELTDAEAAALAAAALGLLASDAAEPAAGRPVPEGVAPLVDAEEVGLRFAAVNLLRLSRASTPEAVEALSKLAKDETKLVAMVAQRRLAQLGATPAEEIAAKERAWAEAIELLAEFDPKDRTASDREIYGILSDLERADTAPPGVVSALDDLLERGKGSWYLRGHVAATLCNVDGPTRERCEILVRTLEINLDPRSGSRSGIGRFARPLRAAADRLDEDQVRTLCAMLWGSDPKRQALTTADASLRALLLACDAGAEVAAPRFAALLRGHPDAWREMLASVGSESRHRPAPGLELPAILVRQGWRFGSALRGGLDIADAFGRVGIGTEQVTDALEHVVEEGHPLARYHAARALRCIKSHTEAASR